jgi:hypothetical protein
MALKAFDCKQSSNIEIIFWTHPYISFIQNKNLEIIFDITIEF